MNETNTIHPVLSRAQKRARRFGCTASTTKGLVRFFKIKGLKVTPPLPKPETAESWKQREALRKADPEAKRAKHDPVFRAKFLRRLRRRNEQARRTRATTLRGITAAATSFAARTKEVREVARLRSIVYGKRIEAKALPHVSAGVLVGGFDADMARRFGAKVCMVGKNASLLSTRRTSFGIHREAVPSTFQNGRWRGYERAVHENYVRSFGVFRANVLDYAFHETEIRLVLPDNFRWDADALGLRALHPNGVDDYHVSARDLLRRDAVTYIVSQIEDNARQRALIKAKEVAERAAMEGVWVCLADSVRAGNCLAGSLAFAARHHLDPKSHYRALALLDIANGDAGRVRLAITAAILRHKRETERGYALLEDHQVNT